MSRVLKWLVLYVLSLGTLSIYVRYTDGLEINFVGWPDTIRAALTRERTP